MRTSISIPADGVIRLVHYARTPVQVIEQTLLDPGARREEIRLLFWSMFNIANPTNEQIAVLHDTVTRSDTWRAADDGTARVMHYLAGAIFGETGPAAWRMKWARQNEQAGRRLRRERRWAADAYGDIASPRPTKKGVFTTPYAPPNELAPRPDHVVEQRELAAAVLDVLAATLNQRDALLLAEILEGVSDAEAERRAGCPPGACRTLFEKLARAGARISHGGIRKID
ncbi:MAG: hypothetical protein HYR74_06800 [Candidatus Eisenbacteria bacterium]|nr:hypothetical protein [Candidatus Eisenbacteria bacterium]